ncbi:MAG: hypothetical protein KH282_00515 [Clostridiales bacterium]|uniref:Uncharacterized protein n=1 Tax=Candidatus Scybalenecus merdavium TaxID=2840939 RepID=A0A9D1MV98_9FIRM|nr:hypothetical protein [Clostridiales bacterium]HIU69698.1 hypothetical protein [Candidatus Scubalenecus merdavium]
MKDRCPKCGAELGKFYFKVNCPKCGVDLMYYNMESRLDQDAEQAEKDWEKVDAFLQKFTKIKDKFKKKK